MNLSYSNQLFLPEFANTDPHTAVLQVFARHKILFDPADQQNVVGEYGWILEIPEDLPVIESPYRQILGHPPQKSGCIQHIYASMLFCRPFLTITHAGGTEYTHDSSTTMARLVNHWPEQAMRDLKNIENHTFHPCPKDRVIKRIVFGDKDPLTPDQAAQAFNKNKKNMQLHVKMFMPEHFEQFDFVTADTVIFAARDRTDEEPMTMIVNHSDAFSIQNFSATVRPDYSSNKLLALTHHFHLNLSDCSPHELYLLEYPAVAKRQLVVA